MSAIELSKCYAKEEGFHEGVQVGIEKGIRENQEHTIKNLIIKFGLSDEQIVTATEATIDYVRKIRASLKK